MHALTRLRRANQEARQQFRGETSLRPILTGAARGGLTPSDLESLETIEVEAYNPDGSFRFIEGYDDVPSYP